VVFRGKTSQANPPLAMLLECEAQASDTTSSALI